MDVGRAFTYITEDPEWITKVLVGGAILLVSAFASVILIGIVGLFVLAGYYLEIVRRVYYGEPRPLPEWSNIGDYLSRGFVVAVGLLIWTLPLLAILGCVAVLAGALNDPAGGTLFLLSLCLGFPLALALQSFVFPVVVGRYAVTHEFNAMFEFDAIVSQIRVAAVPLLIFAAMFIVVSIAVNIGLLACFVGVFFTSHIGYLVLAHLVGQVYRAANPTMAVTESRF